jgi:hypothetical protein
MSDDDFTVWLQAVSPESFEDGAYIDVAWLTWFREIYAELGPVSRDRIDALAGQRIDDTLAVQPWTRIVNDVRRTTGRELYLNVTPDPGTGGLAVEVTLDRELIGTIGRGYCLADPEVLLAEIADYLREFALDEEIVGGWPTCIDHHTHPLDPVVVDGIARWVCPVTRRTVSPIGQLEEVG